MPYEPRHRGEHPRRDEERDRWREGGYRGHGRQEFGPEADDNYGERYGGYDRTRYGEDASADRPRGDDQYRRGPSARPSDDEDSPRGGPYRGAPYRGYGQQGGGFQFAPGAERRGGRSAAWAGAGQQDDFDGLDPYAEGKGRGAGYDRRDYSGRGREPTARYAGYGPGRGFEDRRGDDPGWPARADEDWRTTDAAGWRPEGARQGGEWAGSGPYRGRGPRNYARSDERIREDVCERLTEDSHLDASDIEVTVRAGEVTLSGRIAERRDKRRAEDLVEQVSGVRHVQNNLRCEPERRDPAQGRGFGQSDGAPDWRDSVSGAGGRDSLSGPNGRNAATE